MKVYQIVDHLGFYLAEVKFDVRLDEGMHPVYLQDFCDSMNAVGYASIKQPELSELGKLITD